MTDHQIIKELGMENMAQEVQDQVVSQVNEIVQLRLMGVIDDMMSDEQRAEFETVSANGSKTVVMEWLSSQFTELGELHNATMTDYLEEKKSKS